MALCPSDAARLELSRLGADLNLGASSPEWIIVVLYAESRGILGTATETDRTDIRAQLERIECRLRKAPEPIVAAPMRDLIVFAIALFTCVAVAVVCGVSPAAPIALIAAFVLGLCSALAYAWLAPIISRRR